MNYEYIIALAVLLAVYVGCIFLMKYMRSTRLFNLIFSALVFIPYVALAVIVYRSVGFYDWNFQNVLPVANVSPFMFTAVPVILLLPKSVRKHAYLLISLLTVGMLLSSVLGCIYNASINYKLHFHFLLDYISHFALSLFGIYLVRTKQVDFSLKGSILSGSIIVSSAALMVILNLIFDTSFFGLSLRGKHNIYNNVLVDNSYLSALLYFVGLIGIMAIGFAVCALFNKEKFNLNNKL